MSDPYEFDRDMCDRYEDRINELVAREAKLVGALEEVAGMDCAKYDKYIGIGPCGVCISCKARAALASVKEGK